MEATADVVTRWPDSKERVRCLGESLRVRTQVHSEMPFVAWFGGGGALLHSWNAPSLPFFLPSRLRHSTNTLSALCE